MMNTWDLYQRRIDAKGGTRRNAALQREVRMLNSKLPNTLSYHTVTIDEVEKQVEIINTDNLDIKFIHTLPGEDIDCGSLINWMGYHWLVTERDANTEINTKAKIVQCNYLLKWVNDSGKICEQWCIIEDGTKYLTGEYEDRNFIVTRGDSRIAMTIAKNTETLKFNRDFRFLIDDPESGEKLAYLLTKPLKVGQVYNGKGVYSFVLQEATTTDDDNQELGIADYYKYFSKDNTNNETPDDIPDNTPDETPDNTSGDILDNNTDNTSSVSTYVNKSTPNTGKKVWY